MQHILHDRAQWLADHRVVEGAKVGEGAYGYVTDAVVGPGEHRVIKHIYSLYGDDDDLSEICREFQLARDLSYLDIGPVVYETALLHVTPVGLETGTTGVIVMEKFDTDLASMLLCKKPEHKATKDIVRCLFQLICKMSNRGVTCIDMKPSNVVVNYATASAGEPDKCAFSKMRLIDFGQYCKNDRIDVLLENFKGPAKQKASRALMLIVMQENMKSQIFSRDPKVQSDSREAAWSPNAIFRHKVTKYIQKYPAVLEFLMKVRPLLTEELLPDISKSLAELSAEKQAHSRVSHVK